MERIKIRQTTASADIQSQEFSDQAAIISEVKSFLQEADNKSFDQIKMRHDSSVGKIIVDCITGIKYPEFDDFVSKIKKSKYGSMMLF